MPASVKRPLARIFAFLPLLAAVGVTVRVFWNLARATDLVLADEAFHLSTGSRFLHQGVLPSFEFSPLYAVWYAAHLAVAGDPIVAYYTQLYSVAILTAVLVYVYLRQIAVPTSLALLATILWIAQPAYTKVEWTVGWPRPYHFAFLIFLAGALVIRALKIERPISLLLAGSSFLLLAMAVRNEYLVALLFFFALVAISFRFRTAPLPTGRSSYLWPVSLFAGAATLTIEMYLKGQAGAVPRFGAVARSWSAFGQHFSIYQLAKSNAVGKLNPWDDWEFIVSQTFPRAHSLLGAAFANPKAFWGFELHNLISAPLIVAAYPKMQPYALLKVLVLCLIFIWLCFITLTSASARRRALFTTAAALGPYMLSGAAAVIPGILITPKISYSLPLLFVLFVGAVKWVCILFEDEPAIFRSVAAASALLLSLTFAVIRSPFDVNKGAEKALLSEASDIRAILEHQKLGGVRIFQIGGTGYSAFLPDGLSESVDIFDRDYSEPFWNFIRREHIDAILVDDRLRANREYKDDPDFASLLASPDKFGWAAAPVGTRGDIFYLRHPSQNNVRQ